VRNRDKLRQFKQHLPKVLMRYELEQGIGFM